MNLPSRYVPTGTAFSGGQGVVLVWNDTSLNRDVAVKVLSKGGIGGSLLDEAALLAAVKSKHVVELFEIGRDPSSGEDYLIMEYVNGGDLVGYKPTTLRDFYLTMYQISAGVADIHAANCLHRDLKPNNLKRDGAEIIKIIDFGIGAPTPVVNTISGRGTNGYRGPEYFVDPIRLTDKADVYAVGVIGYEFAFGSLDAPLHEAPPKRPASFAAARIGKSGKTLEPDVVALLDKCFEPNPANRPTAEALRRLFAKHLLRGQHIAEFIYGGRTYLISNSARSFRISTGRGSFDVTYDGLDFLLSSVTGEIYVNGMTVVPGHILPGSCVITIGSGAGPDRAFIPFNVSHPEVVL